jgi:hypothetical protein
MNLLIAFHTIL